MTVISTDNLTELKTLLWATSLIVSAEVFPKMTSWGAWAEEQLCARVSLLRFLSHKGLSYFVIVMRKWTHPRGMGPGYSEIVGAWASHDGLVDTQDFLMACWLRTNNILTGSQDGSYIRSLRKSTLKNQSALSVVSGWWFFGKYKYLPESGSLCYKIFYDSKRKTSASHIQLIIVLIFKYVYFII